MFELAFGVNCVHQDALFCQVGRLQTPIRPPCWIRLSTRWCHAAANFVPTACRPTHEIESSSTTTEHRQRWQYSTMERRVKWTVRCLGNPAMQDTTLHMRHRPQWHRREGHCSIYRSQILTMQAHTVVNPSTTGRSIILK